MTTNNELPPYLYCNLIEMHQLQQDEFKQLGQTNLSKDDKAEILHNLKGNIEALLFFIEAVLQVVQEPKNELSKVA